VKDTISALLKGGNYLKPEQRSLFVVVANQAI